MEEADIKAQEVSEEVLPHIMHNRLPDPLEQHNLSKGNEKDQAHQKAVEEYNVAYTLHAQIGSHICGENILVNSLLHEPWHKQGCQTDQKGQDNGRRKWFFETGTIRQDPFPEVQISNRAEFTFF